MILAIWGHMYDVAEDSFDLDNDTFLQGTQVMGVSGLEHVHTM